ncbi:B-cell receptor CD22-like [Corythoichthys intestinalis]|uniref:B-cell receptor CD22-like n=1 Tax=Corythoichthys intestinalis TaxID=161448 RepID=UPI0025A5313F|nr:B-cell receptor CD22-like [Corythoichthys intestinalis]
MKKSWIFMVLITSVLSEDWKVTFENQCALEGMTVHVKCQYRYPRHHNVTSTHWLKKIFGVRFIHISYLRNFEYVGNRVGDCSLRINSIQHADDGYYRFGFITTHGTWLSKNELRLSVKDLTASVEPTTVTEGQNVSLTCRSGCNTNNIVWYRDGKVVDLKHPIFQASRKDSGRYHCAIFGQEKIKSASVTLNVQYAPSNIVVSLTPTEDIINGSAVTLSCSSDANPPVPQNGYSLYKDNQLINSGPSHTISVLQPRHSGRYHCRASNNITLSGITFVKSTEFNLDVQYLPSVEEGGSVTVMCNSAANPFNHSYMWYKWISSSSVLHVGSGQMLSLPFTETPLNGVYLCEAQSQYEVVNSTTVLLLMEQHNFGHLTVGILGGLGGILFVMLVLLLFYLWRKHKKTGKKEIKAQFSSQEVSSAPTEDQPHTIYANVNMDVPSPRSLARKYSKKQQANVMHSYGHVKTRSQLSDPQSHDNQLSISNDDEVTYTAVTSEVKKTRFDKKGLEEYRFKVGETADSVTYSTLANFS